MFCILLAKYLAGEDILAGPQNIKGPLRHGFKVGVGAGIGFRLG